MKEQILNILTEVSKGKISPEIAYNELSGLLNAIDCFDFNATAVTIQEQAQFLNTKRKNFKYEIEKFIVANEENYTHIKFYYTDYKMVVNKFTYENIYPNEKDNAIKFEYLIKVE